MLCLSIHALPLWGRRGRLAKLHFMMHLRRHTSTDATKDNVGNSIDNTSQRIISFAICKGRHTTQQTRKIKETIGASDQANVVFVQSQLVGFAKYIGSGRSSWSWANGCLGTHAAGRTCLLAHLSRLQAAASSKVALEAFVVGPSRSRGHMVQSLVTHVNLNWTEANYGAHQATGFSTRCLAQTNVKFGRVVVNS